MTLHDIVCIGKEVSRQMTMELRVGGRYRLGRKIGSGSFGDIYLGKVKIILFLLLIIMKLNMSVHIMLCWVCVCVCVSEQAKVSEWVSEWMRMLVCVCVCVLCECEYVYVSHKNIITVAPLQLHIWYHKWCLIILVVNTQREMSSIQTSYDVMCWSCTSHMIS